MQSTSLQFLGASFFATHVREGNLVFSGTNASGPVSRTLQINVVADVTFPSSCVAPATCGLVPLVIGSRLPGATATCTGTTSCVCTIT